MSFKLSGKIEMDKCGLCGKDLGEDKYLLGNEHYHYICGYETARELKEAAVNYAFKMNSFVALGISLVNREFLLNLFSNNFRENETITSEFNMGLWRTNSPSIIMTPPETPKSTKIRPVQGGVSVGNVNFPVAGTIGGVVIINNEFYILSSGRALAPENFELRDEVSQDAFFDGGNEKDVIGFLSSTALPVKGNSNTMDCAVALVYEDVGVAGRIVRIGNLGRTAEPMLGMRVMKRGRTTDTTYGIIICTDATVSVIYPHGEYIFRDQIIVASEKSHFALSGDEGSFVLDGNKNVLGIILASSSDITVVSPIDPVLERFGARLLRR
ncbi:MAG: Nal1-like putative serine protease [Thermoplasmataceae archaeon]